MQTPLSIIYLIFTLFLPFGLSYQSLCKIRSNYCQCESSDNVEVQLSNLLRTCCQPGILKLKLKSLFMPQVAEDSFTKSPCHQLEDITLNMTTELIPNEETAFLQKNSFVGLPNLKRLAIVNNRDLVSLPKGVFQGLGGSLLELSLSNNRIKSLNGKEFEGFSAKKNRLKTLDLSRNEISTLQTEFFQQLTHEGTSAPLLNLKLDHNKLTFIKQEMFSGLESLESLSILENPIETLYGGSFRNLNNLRTLYISGTQQPKRKGGDIVQLTQAMFHGLVNLKSLKLNNLGIEDVQPDAFLEIADLTSLDLANNQIREVPTVVLERLGSFLGKQLEELNLSHNEIICINDNPFKYLNRLRVLDLSHNNLRIINDKTLKGLDNLQQLILTGNNIHKIAPYSFTHFKRLNELHVSILLKRELKIVREAFLKSALGILSNRTRIVGLENMGIQHGGNSRYLDDFTNLESFDCAVEEFIKEEENLYPKEEEVFQELENDTFDLLTFIKENKKTLILILVTIAIVVVVLIFGLMIYRCCCRRSKKRKDMRSRLFSDTSSSSHVKSSILPPDSYNYIGNYKPNGGYNSAGSFSPVSNMGPDSYHNQTMSSESKLRNLFGQTNCMTATMGSNNSGRDNQGKYRESDILHNLQIAPPPYPQHSRSPFLGHHDQNGENLSSASGTLISNTKVSSLVGGVRAISTAGSTERTNTTPCTNSSIDGNLGILLQPNSPNSINNEFPSGINFDALNNFGLV